VIGPLKDNFNKNVNKWYEGVLCYLHLVSTLILSII